MPLPESYLPRAGDVLVLHAVVKYDVRPDDPLHVFVRPVGYYADCRIDLSDVAGLHARHWEPGESARLDDMAVTVIAVDGDEAWIKLPNGTRNSVHVNALDAVPIETPAMEPPAPSQTDDCDPIAGQRMDAADVALVDGNPEPEF